MSISAVQVEPSQEEVTESPSQSVRLSFVHEAPFELQKISGTVPDATFASVIEPPIFTFLFNTEPVPEVSVTTGGVLSTVKVPISSNPEAFPALSVAFM